MRISRNQFASLLLAGSLLVAPCVQAATVVTPITQITYIHSYTDFGAGDVAFGTGTLASGCDGFWLNPNDVGFKQSYAMLALSKATQANVTIYAYDNQLWNGTASHFCKVMLIRVE